MLLSGKNERKEKGLREGVPLKRGVHFFLKGVPPCHRHVLHMTLGRYAQERKPLWVLAPLTLKGVTELYISQKST